jgi:hypothetical protein|tara:strand:- start:3154 stop:3387 length:234 start_codon:yes stop_codon:yes gene_type:complete
MNIFLGPNLSNRIASGIYWIAPEKKKILVKKPISVAFSENVTDNSGARIAFVFLRKKDNIYPTPNGMIIRDISLILL